MRLFVVVEGDTELEFARRTLGPHLDAHGVYTTPIEVATRRDRRTRAKTGRGGGHWKHWEKDISILTKSNVGADVRFTTLFDLYGLPEDFPELSVHITEQDTTRRAERLEDAMAKRIGDWRFVPYLQRHELEALVLVGLDELEIRLDQPSDREGVRQLRESLAGMAPEDVDDGVDTHPSRRLETSARAYQKKLHGPDVIHLVGVGKLKQQCPRFGAWVTQLEQLATTEHDP